MGEHHMVRCLLTISFLLLAVCSVALCADSVIIIIREVPDDFFQDAGQNSSGAFNHTDNTYTVIGGFTSPLFSIPAINNVAVYDANSRQIRLVIEESSIHREFDDVSEIRFAFEIDKKALAAGQPKLKWGSDVSANNVLVEKIPIDAANRERYRTFAWEELPPEENCSPQTATLEVIVDDQANLYFLWYLLPMALIFGLLVLRKLYLGKMPPATDQ
jgi:hypothetical protein